MEKNNFWIDPQGGMAGDMFTAALLDMGAPEAAVLPKMEAAARELGQARLHTSRSGDGALRLHIGLETSHAHLEAGQGRQILERLFDGWQTPQAYRSFALRAYQILLEAEQKAHSENHFSGDHFHVSPIGTAHSPYTQDAPFQPAQGAGDGFFIRVFPEYTEGLYRLDSFSHLLCIAYLDRSEGYALTVSPPWTDVQVGLFATRSPFRPNPIGFNVLEIKRIEGDRIYTGPTDFLDNTPVLDIKPAVGQVDGIAAANNGWVGDKALDFSHKHTHTHEHNHGHSHSHSHAPGKTYLHEAQDILVDIVGAATALEALGLPPAAQLLAPVSAGAGTVRFSHGHLDVPAPATQNIFDTYHIPWQKGPLDTELCTPTGAALLAALGASNSTFPRPAPQRTGLARGSKTLDIPPLRVGS